MSDYNWETVEVPQGSFVGWGTSPGQHVTGKVLTFSPAGGQDFNGEPCPQLTLELVESAASFNKAGERTDFPVGDVVSLTVGQSGLKRAVQSAQPDTGDLVKITLTGTEVTKKGNTIKVFDLKIARGAGGPAAQQQAPAATQAAPPF